MASKVSSGVLACLLSTLTTKGCANMPKGILQTIFERVQVSQSEQLVLDAILAKANLYGKHAKVAHEVIQAMTGLARSTVYAAIARLEKVRHLLRVDRKLLCLAPGSLGDCQSMARAALRHALRMRAVSHHSEIDCFSLVRWCRVQCTVMDVPRLCSCHLAGIAP